MRIESADRSELLQGAGYVYSLLPLADVVRCLDALASPLLARLSQVCGASATTAPSSTEVCALLDELASLSRYCQPSVPEFENSHPIAHLLSAAWPVLTLVYDKLGKDSRAMEKLCRVLKFSVRTATTHAVTFLPGMLTTLSSWFLDHPHSCFLYAVHVCATQLAGTSHDLDDALFGVYSSMASRVFLLLTPKMGQDLVQALGAFPDVLEDFFELSLVTFMRFRDRLLAGTTWPPLVQLCSGCVLLEHREAWRACTHLAEGIFGSCARRVDVDPHTLSVLDATVAQHGPVIMRGVTCAIAGVLPPARVPQCTALLRAMMEGVPESAGSWLEHALGALPVAAHEDAKILLTACTRSPVSWPEVRRAVDDFSDVCRRKRIIA